MTDCRDNRANLASLEYMRMGRTNAELCNLLWCCLCAVRQEFNALRTGPNRVRKPALSLLADHRGGVTTASSAEIAQLPLEIVALGLCREQMLNNRSLCRLLEQVCKQ